jgi:hypothetical protein
MPSLLDLLPHGPPKYIVQTIPTETGRLLLQRRVFEAERLASSLADRVANVEKRIVELQFPTKTILNDDDDDESHAAADALLLLASAAAEDVEPSSSSSSSLSSSLSLSANAKRKRKRSSAIGGKPTDTSGNSTADVLRSIALSSSSSSIYIDLAKSVCLPVDPAQPLRMALPLTATGCLSAPSNGKFASAFRAMISADNDGLLRNDAIRGWFVEAWTAIVSAKAVGPADNDDHRLPSAACAFGFFVMAYLSFSSNPKQTTTDDDRSRIDSLLAAEFTANRKTDDHLVGGWPARLVDWLYAVPLSSSSTAVKKAQLLLRLIQTVFAPLTASITPAVGDKPADAAVVALIGHLPLDTRLDLARRLKSTTTNAPLTAESARAVANLPAAVAWSSRSSAAFKNLLGAGRHAGRTAKKILDILSDGLAGSATVVSICLTAALSAFVR